MIGRPHGAVSACGLALAISSGCGEDIARIELVLVPHEGMCGQVMGANDIRITALAESGETSESFSPADTVSIDSFPPDTRQLALEVRRGGVLASIGKTAPFTVDDAAPTIPISIAPPDDMCAVKPLVHARKRAIVVPAGDGALVVGGTAAGAPVEEIEYFDPRANAFSAVTGPSGLSAGLRGVTFATLADGRVVIIAGGQAAWAVFDPATSSFPAPAAILDETQALAAVVALDDHRVLIAGGCSTVDAATDTRCLTPAVALRKVYVLDVDAGRVTPRADLQLARANGTASLAFDASGIPIVVVAGGVDPDGAPVTDVERIEADADGGTIDTIPGAVGLATVLDPGSVLTSLAPPGTPFADAASVVVPGLPTARMIDRPPARSEAALVTLEDGTVLAIGGRDGLDQPAAPLVYRPMQGWRELTAAARPLMVNHAVTRLADGSVLIVGGSDATGEVTAAWRFRPSLIGPFTGQVTVTPGPGEDDRFQLAALDPGLVNRAGGGYRLQSEGGAENLALISGPRLAEGTLTATIEVVDVGGFAAIARSSGPGDRIDVAMIPGQAARVDRITAGVRTALCTGALVPVLAGTAGVRVTLTIVDNELTIRRDQNPPDVDSCNLGDPEIHGLWGLGAYGDGTQIEIETISVDR